MARAFWFRPRVSGHDRIFFAKQLSVLTAADVPLLEGLEMIRSQGRSRGLSIVLTDITQDVRNGKSLSRSMAKHANMFGEFAIGVVAIGETTGSLSNNLEYLATELKKGQLLKRKVFGALLYPAVITIATLALTCFLILYLFPKLMPIFLSLNVALPLSTRIVMGTSVFLGQYGLFLILFVAVCVSIFLIGRRRYPRLSYLANRFFLKIPFLKTFIRHYNVTQSMRSLGLLLASGMPLSSGLYTLGYLTRNPLYKEEWISIAGVVDCGDAMSVRMIQRADLFPGMMVHMIAVGERSGDLCKSLIYIADAHEGEFDEYTKSFSTLLEPALMICMGLLIGVVAISIITPIYGLTEHLQS